MAGNTVIRINIKDDAQVSMKGRRFSDIPLNARTVSWILGLPHVTGQMAEIVAFLGARDRAREARSTERARVVYMLPAKDDARGARTVRTVVEAGEVSELVKENGRAAALAGGLRCEHGHVMKFVAEHMSRGSAVAAYFAHVTKSDGARAGGGGSGGGGCSDVHLLAQVLIKKNISRIVATRFKICGECIEFAFKGESGMRAEIEVTEVRNTTENADGKIRSDVVVYKNDERQVSFEVKHTHATEPSSRAGLPYLEVAAGHVVSQFEFCAGTGAVRLKCENATSICRRGCAARREAAAKARPPSVDHGAPCWACEGSGEYRGGACGYDGSYRLSRDCRVCDGVGRLYRRQ